MATRWRWMPKHFNHMCSLLQVKGFLCLAGEMVVWQRSWVCQHKVFCRNVLSLDTGLQGSWASPFALSLLESLLFSLAYPGNLLDILKCLLFLKFFPVCFLKYLSECLLSFSPQEPLPECLLPPWWLWLGCHGQQFWPCWCVCPRVGTAYDWDGVTRGFLR